MIDRPLSWSTCDSYVDVGDGHSDFLEVLFVVKSVDVVDALHVERVRAWIVGACDGAARLTSTEDHLVTL